MGKFQALDATAERRLTTGGERSTPDLARLIRRAADGDVRSFHALYTSTAPKLLAVALRIVRDRSIAEEVMQEAFLKAWRGAGGFDPEAGRAMTWLVTIVRRCAIDVVRSRGEAIRQAEPISDHADRIADPADHGVRFEAADGLSRCLDRLDPTHRTCFVQAYVEGLSREELAQAFGKPVNTIKTWLHRSAAALRSCLGEV